MLGSIYIVVSRWMFLILLFLICGCGKTVPIEKYNELLRTYNELLRTYEDEQLAHANTQLSLTLEQDAHKGTRQKLTNEETAHARTQQQLATEKDEHTETQGQLATEQTRHASTQRQLKTEQGKHARTQQQLATEKDEHSETQGQLATEQTRHASTQRQLANEERELKKFKDEYERLKAIKAPTVRTYFELGRVSLEFGLLEEEARKIKEALSLYDQARKTLQTVIRTNESSDAHYYLARAYYMLARHGEAEFEDACAHAKKAINLAPSGKHADAEALKGNIANCK